MHIVEWLRTRDAGLSALRRSARAAIVMPAVFALAHALADNPALAVFSAFGGLATLLFVDFGGPLRERLAAQASLVAAGAVLISLGTLASRSVWLAATAMLVVGFAVLFAGVVSSVLAGATTALLVSFILPVTLPGPAASIPDRLAGWLLAGAASLVAVATLWPAPSREPLRQPAARACALLARRVRAEVEYADAAAAAVAALRTSFFDTPYRPTGLSTAARTLVRVVDEVIWLDTVLGPMPADPPAAPVDPAVWDVCLAAAAVLERAGELLDSTDGSPDRLERELRRLEAARLAMEAAVIARDASDHDVEALIGSLEPSFRAQEMSFATAAIAANIQLTVAARRRPWWQHVLGRRPAGAGSPLTSAQERAGARVERHSVWLQNSVRGAIALSLAIFVAELTGVQHSFWVVLGTLAVLRSNALNTGENALRGLLGTVAGFVIGGGLLLAVGTNTTLLWLLLPPAVAFAGLAPAVSFAAGQAGFTATLLILFNILSPAGWAIGLVRIEDVAIGCAVSVVVGLLFWPRGAAPALAQALAAGLADGAIFVRSAIGYGVTRGAATLPSSPVPGDERHRAAAAARRLDDAFRAYLSERGTKHIPLADVATLITAVAVLRLTAEAILDLWERDDGAAAGGRAAARTEVLDAGAQLAGWYEATARALAGSGAVPDQLGPDAVAAGRLIAAVRRDLAGEDGPATAAAVKLIWTSDHIDAARRLQAAIVGPARAAVAAQAGSRPWLRSPSAST